MRLFEPNPFVLKPSTTAPTSDHAPDELAQGSPTWLRDELQALLSVNKVLSRATDLIRFATDASPYRLFPKVVVFAHSVEDVRAVFGYAQRRGLPVTLRAAGTSLSGQAQSDGILLEVKRHWVGAVVEDGGRRLRVKPGTILAHANVALQAHGYRLGPDPASASACTIGGVIANNSSGMCCGTVQNSYQTLHSLTFLLPSGTLIDTAEPDAEVRFAKAEPELAQGLLAIKREIEADAALVARIRSKYQIKNTTGYHVQAFLDGDTPLDIFRRLLVGSEGTLAFIAEAVFETVPDDQFRSTSFLVFPDVRSACAAVQPFVESGAAAVELIDRASLRAVEGKPGVPAHWRTLPDTAAGLLVEYREASEAARQAAGLRAQAILDTLPLLEPTVFTSDPVLAAQFWKVRSGLLASVGGARPSGSSFILEDVCFPPEHLADGALEIQALFAKHGYDGVIFGHASAGNLHFLITPFLNDPYEVARYTAFMEDVVQTVVERYDGSLKAEHGTGRNVAPFVEREWGTTLTEMMWRVKHLADPQGTLAPDVLLSRDPQLHIKHLHTTPPIEAVADRCIECGYCEHVCPSRLLTTTPRQRIILRREMMRQPADSPVLQALLREYEYDAIETCAGDGMCTIACPVDINTGTMMKYYRGLQHPPVAEFIAAQVAQYWGKVEALARTVVDVGNRTGAVGDVAMTGLTSAARAFVTTDLVPAWTRAMPQAAQGLPHTKRAGAVAVYFSACINRIFGPDTNTPAYPTLQEAMVAVSARAGLPLWIPDDVAGTCCATVWQSKGYKAGNVLMANRLVENLWRWSEKGKLPIVIDASSCSYGVLHEVVPHLSPENATRHSKLAIYDSVAWAHDHLLPRLNVKRKVKRAVIHPTCSTEHLGLSKTLLALAAALAEEAVKPKTASCCGFAGDRGFLHPELARAATWVEANEVRQHTYDAYLCSNRTCEVGMRAATGQSYQSVIFLLEAVTRGSETT